MRPVITACDELILARLRGMVGEQLRNIGRLVLHRVSSRDWHAWLEDSLGEWADDEEGMARMTAAARRQTHLQRLVLGDDEGADESDA